MRYGIRECCDVVLRAKNKQQVGNKVFYKNEPVCYFDTLKTSSLEGAATTVYAQGGRGNSRLVAWEGERTLTFSMEDALISPEGLMILTGAGLIEASAAKPIYQHMTETVDARDCASTGDDAVTEWKIPLSEVPYLPEGENDNFAYVMFMKDGEIISEPFIPVHGESAYVEGKISVKEHACYAADGVETYEVALPKKGEFDAVLVDFYVARAGGKQIDIEPDKFSGNFYLEASTLFRDENGVDWPAEFIIPNCKVQSNFTFTMASSGDPSTFTFTMDAFPGYTRFDASKKVLAALQVIDTEAGEDIHRGDTGFAGAAASAVLNHENQFAHGSKLAGKYAHGAEG